SPAGRDGSRPETADPRVRGGRLRGARRRADPGDGPHHLPPPPTASSVPPRFLPAGPPARPRPEREVPPARTQRPHAPHHLLDTRGSTHRCRVTDRRRTAVADHPVDEKLPALKMATTGLQHVAAMY